MIHGFKVHVAGTVFTAVSTTNIVDRTTKELSEEIIPSLDNSKTDKTSNISYSSTQKAENSALVAFKDPTNDKYVILSLKDSTLNKLKSHFEENDFYERKDGITRLDNKAEAFVGGWFGDIAYKREFLKADSNADGKLSDGEYKNTRNAYYIEGGISDDNKSLYEHTRYNYLKVSEKEGRINYRVNNRPHNLDNELDWTLFINNDFNQEISLKESYSSMNNPSNYENIVFGHAMKFIPKAVKEAMEENLVLKLLKEANEEQLKRLKTLEKLKQNGGDTLQLSKDEKEFISTELEKVTNKDGSIDTDKLEKIINSNKTSMTYNEIDSSEMLGKFYEDKG